MTAAGIDRAAIAALAGAGLDSPWPGPGSRRMELRSR